MCGFVGVIDPQTKLEHPHALLRRAAGYLAHRGPDAESFWHEGPVHLAHRRLAVVDLSPSGLQPMHSSDGRYVLVFNGEIYNHAELRAAFGLRNTVWRGHSDTEVLLEYIRVYGLRRTLESARGMFALALWDRHTMALSLARDRFGEKPLMFGWLDGVFVFGSELHVLKAFDSRPPVNEKAVALFCRYGYVPAPLTIFEGFEKVLPGTYREVSYSELQRHTNGKAETYWSVDEARQLGEYRQSEGLEQKIQRLESLLTTSVAEQLTADVPVGALLSGGIDSSLVVALAKRVSAAPVKTFTIGFEDPRYDEAPFARAIATHLGTDHTELYIGEADLLSLVQDLPRVYDEPFADPSQLPTLLVSRLVRQYVTVCLSGDGGDELFRGYERYVKGARLWQRLGVVPAALRGVGARVIAALPPKQLDFVLGPLVKRGITGDRLQKASTALGSASADAFYDGLARLPGGTQLLRSAGRPGALALADAQGLGFTDYASSWDCRYYLPDDILVKVDRAAMSASLETRAPLLHPDLLELAWSASEAEHIRGVDGKQLLRAVLARHVPRALFERPKQGFGVPLENWLRGPLKDWAHAQLEGLRSRQLSCLDTGNLLRMWNEHQNGHRNWAPALWAACQLAAFLDTWDVPAR